MISSKLTTIELFSGPGGLGLGFHLAGFKTLVAYEYEDDCINTYKANFSETKVVKKDLSHFSEEEIRELKQYIFKKTGKESVDVVMGGPPCRSFSTSNPKKKHGDKRDYLYKQLIKVANELNAKYFLMENVDDILSKSVDKHSKELIFHQLLKDLQEAGFLYINFRVLNAADFGVPQTRERIFIIATKDPNLPLTFPSPTHSQSGKDLPRWVNVDEAFRDLPCVSSPRDSNIAEDQSFLKHKGRGKGEYYCDCYRDQPDNNFTRYCRGIINDIYPSQLFCSETYDRNILTLFIVPDHTERIIARYSYLQEDENQGNLVKRLKSELSLEKYNKLVEQKVLPMKVFIQKNRKLPLNIPARTVTSHAREELVHPCVNRNLTAREVARLQSFPDWYIFTGANQKPFKPHSEKDIGMGRDYYQQIGDAVPPLLAFAVGQELKKNLSAKIKVNHEVVRAQIIQAIYSDNIRVQDIRNIFKIGQEELVDILSGITNPAENLIKKLSDLNLVRSLKKAKYIEIDMHEPSEREII